MIMRIKRVAFTGTFILVTVCLALYLILDRTFTADLRLNNDAPSYSSQVAERSLFLVNQTSKHRNANTEEHRSVGVWSQQCAASHPSPKVNVQMLHVYDTLKFDNVDGGAWKQGWNIVYNEREWTQQRKLRIFVVPHSHNDPGWKKTFEEYYQSQTRHILNNMVRKLREDPRRKFIWAEISFFALWWSEVSQETRDQLKELVGSGQLEFVGGGWVMPDEATTHYYSLVEQLVQGHQWLLHNLNYVPKHGWSIDPFGHSPTLAYLLKKCGFESHLIQRTHYSVKKYLARKKLLEFRWLQLWDGEGETGLWTHMMPFYSYDVPHTCGPEPKICCQFDFKRLPGYGVTCPWRVPPQPITDTNLPQRAALLLDQYRKKAQLYSTNVVLVPLGDDFRYDHLTEWDAQFNNYQKLFDFINNNSFMNAHAEFGTLSDYLKAVEEERQTSEFPSLSGDFFTYADRDDHYWSGYYTSRPYYKRLDRLLISYLRSAEILLSQCLRKDKSVEGWSRLAEGLGEARASLSLFQHHDGITGTAKDHVVNDYAIKMLEAIKQSEHVIQQAAHFLLSQATEKQSGVERYFLVMEHQKVGGALIEEALIRFPTGIQARQVTLFNPLTRRRKEVISLKVENLLVQVRDPENKVIEHESSPACSVAEVVAGESLRPPNTCYIISFIAEVPPLALVTYTLQPAPHNRSTEVRVRVVGERGAWLGDWGAQDKGGGEGAQHDFALQSHGLSVAFTKQGFLKAVTVKSRHPTKPSVTHPIHLSFVKYGARGGREQSGAYLFLPEGEAERLRPEPAQITVLEGSLTSQLILRLANIVHTVTIYNSPEVDNVGIEIRNLVNIASVQENYELAMRFSTDINNGNVFYTDLNGMQMIKRKTQSKIPLQGNFYPMSSSVYIEDANSRLTILSGQPLGVAALKQGQIEIMEERRLHQDDNRGLDQGVTDNKATLSLFRLLIETRTSLPQSETRDGGGAVWGGLSPLGHGSLAGLLYPLERLLWEGDPRAGPAELSSALSPLPAHVSLVTLLPLSDLNTGLVLHSTQLDSSFAPTVNQPPTLVNLTDLLGLTGRDKVFRSSLSFNQIGDEVKEPEQVSLCNFDLASFFVRSNQ